jgi:hypothetical protein
MKRYWFSLLMLAIPCLAGAASQDVSGVWNTTVAIANNAVPFRIGFSGYGADVKGYTT